MFSKSTEIALKLNTAGQCGEEWEHNYSKDLRVTFEGIQLMSNRFGDALKSLGVDQAFR
ncbi:MAG: hypothetical protein RMK50_04615 [Nitrososphaerota archaeon]|nr:hypothetical protein [Candidatus Bathyarchaeota archaeon]MDW8194082.1 hypothetical protein [Nitrososphaerota archaeon]